MLAVIPARGGSIGLPGKNIHLLSGKPLIAYTIKAALQSKQITEVILSTDDPEIELISKKYGAEAPFLRPPALATDTALAIDNYIYTLNRLESERNESFDQFIVLQPTSPLRTSVDIDNAISLFRDNSADSVISYTEESHPIHWHKYIDKDGRFLNIFEEHLANRQELRKSYYPNGAIFVFRTDLIRKRMYYSDNSYAYIMPRNRSVDIDTLDDFQYAEFIIGKMKNGC